MHMDDLAKSDLDVFFNPDETYPAVWTVEGMAPVSMDVLFEENYQVVDPDTNAVVMSSQPRMECRVDEMPAVVGDFDVVEVKGERFTIEEIQGDGLTRWVYLHREVA